MPFETEKYGFLRNENGNVIFMIEDFDHEVCVDPLLIIDDKNHQCSFQYNQTNSVILNNWSEDFEDTIGDNQKILVVEDTNLFDDNAPKSDKPSFFAKIVHINCH
ncbi:MAG: hypothetical protein CMP22_06060 [Rickettsiales bacterium]|nr:hypothetical protein [Rickettsiales bacterium]